MSNKGKIFTEADLSAGARARMGPEKVAAWCAEQTERNRIVAIDRAEKDRPLIAEELNQRAINKLSSKARRAAGMMMNMGADDRVQVLGAFERDGKLKLPFEFVP